MFISTKYEVGAATCKNFVLVLNTNLSKKKMAIRWPLEGK